jgi:hypothetical protein
VSMEIFNYGYLVTTASSQTRPIIENYIKFEVFTAVIMKYDILWNIKIQFMYPRKHITFSLQSPQETHNLFATEPSRLTL